ncbi:3491_t:CDS:2, partial [Paraglomus brasilianum]
DEFSFEINPESGEPQYILFIDEANQVSENTFARKSSGLTFLKECMGSDNYKKNESHNLWIIATNHLSEIDEAVYQPDNNSLSEEDNNNEDNKKIINEEKETSEEGEETIKQKDVVVQASNHISKALDTRLKELDKNITEIKEEVQIANNVFNENFNNAVEQIAEINQYENKLSGLIQQLAELKKSESVGYVCKKGHDAYKQSQKSKREKYALKSKSLEAAREDNKRLDARDKEIDKELNQEEQKEKQLEKEAIDIKKELDDPNISKERESELR